MRPVCLALAATLAFAAPARAKGDKDWWVVVGYVDHEPLVWVDEVLTKGNALEAQLQVCGQGAFWDFAAKFDGFDTDGRGSVIVVAAAEPLSEAVANDLLSAVLPCVPDAYVKAARYFGE